MTNEKEVIECECGAHMLVVSTDIEIYENGVNDVVTDKTRVHQTYYLAMFNYGYAKSDTLRHRIGVLWNYLKTGKMHSDQMVMAPDEAEKLAKFITDKLVPTQKG